jgi:hypothetical protein
MVSKKAKDLRRQAVLRAEKYEMEQKEKMLAAAAKISQYVTTAVGPTIYPQATRTQGHSLRQHSKPQREASTGIANRIITDPSNERPATAEVGPDTRLLTEKKTTRMTLAANKKEYHIPVVATSRYDPNGHCGQESCAARPARLPFTSTAYSMVGGIAAESFPLPSITPHNLTFGSANEIAAPTMAKFGTDCSSSTKVLELKNAEQLRLFEPTKSLFLSSFADVDTSFAFDSIKGLRSQQHGRPKTSLSIPAAAITPKAEPSEFGIGPAANDSRSSFDVLRDCAAAVPMATGNEAIQEKVTVMIVHEDEDNDGHTCHISHAILALSESQLLSGVEAVHIALQCEPLDAVSSVLKAGALNEIYCLQQQDMMPAVPVQTHSAPDEYRRNMEFGLSHSIATGAFQERALDFLHKTHSPQEQPKPEDGYDTWDFQRTFFADTKGHTHMVDLTQTLYDVDVLEDDGASDFDSIASPVKFNLRHMSDCEDCGTISSEEIDGEVDVDGLYEMCQFDCTLFTSGQKDYCNMRPSTLLSVSEDEGIIDPSIVFITSESTGADGTEYIEKAEETACTVLPEVEVCNASILEQISGKQLCDTKLLAQIDTTYQAYDINVMQVSCDDNPVGFVPPDHKANTTAGVGCAPSPKPSSADWANELSRITTGTELLFIFLQHLKTTTTGTTTNSAIVAAFLQLVDLERKKLGERLLPSSYTASSVMASQIMPHTIFLGNKSLASFLQHISFGEQNEATIEDVYGAFKTVHKESLHCQIIPTTGIMGMLGRRLGELPL